MDDDKPMSSADWLNSLGGSYSKIDEDFGTAHPGQDEPAPPDPAALGYWVDDFSDADTTPEPPRPWVVRNFLLRGCVTTMFGATGEGKSSMAILWAVMLAINENKLPNGGVGRFNSPGTLRVSIYSLEEDLAEQRRRVRATLRQFGGTFADLGGRVRSSGCDKAGTLLEYDPSCGKLKTTGLYDLLRAHIELHRPDVLFLDPLVELHTAPENDNALLRLVTAMLRALAREYNIAVVLLHHARKGEVIPGDIEALRGAGAIGGAVRFGFTVCSMREDDAQQFGLPPDKRSYHLRLDRAKASYSPPVTEADWFERVSHLDPAGEFVGAIHPWTPPTVIRPSQQAISAILSDIAAGAPNSEPWSPKLDDTVERSVRHLLKRHNITGLKAEKVAMSALQEAGMTIADYRRTARVTQKGLRVGNLPAAAWIVDPEDDGAGQ
jgi:hypothetical protein